MAWTTVYSFEGTSNGSIWRTGEIRALFPNSISVDEKRKFTRIHKTVLRILHLDLEKQLFHNRSTIDDEDADGKTALSWAAARGDSKSVETLLRYGASPHIPDRIGQGPLRQSIKAHDASCTKLLLAYGAQRQVLMNARDFEGNSPLIEAVAGNHPEAVRVLLAHEAEVNHTNDHGHTPFYIGVQRNSHEALAVLSTAFSIQHALRDKYGNSILHCAAEWADIETLNLLHVVRLLGLNIADTNVDGLTAIDVAEKRRLSPQGERNVDSAWVTAFGELLESLARIETPMSATFSVSEGSDDLFVDALQNLTGEELANLAEMGCISRRAETVDEIEKL
ncbi:hypothetical protein MMC31_000387 [Peltigera leucophlebia]|nr:hypothetical protein [Peltigera leucophlebia]